MIFGKDEEDGGYHTMKRVKDFKRSTMTQLQRELWKLPYDEVIKWAAHDVVKQFDVESDVEINHIVAVRLGWDPTQVAVLRATAAQKRYEEARKALREVTRTVMVISQ